MNQQLDHASLMASDNDLEAHRKLDKRLFSGIAWTAVFRWFAQFISWAIMLYVARILSPDDFGLSAMAMIPIGLARLANDLGLDAVIVQNRDLTDDQVSQLGGLAILVGVALTTLFLMLAKPVAGYFNEPAVAGLIAILSLTFIADALQIVPRALLQRDLAFQRLAWINALQMIATSAALGLFATIGFSYWSLALNAMTGSVVVTIVLLIMRPHRLSLPQQIKSLLPSMKSGSNLLIARICWYGYSNMDQMIIGKFLGKSLLGAYSFSMTFARVPNDEITSLVGKVVPGIFSTVQKETDKLRRYFLMLTEALSYITFPLALGLMLTADDFVRLVLGSQWDAVIGPLRILCVYTMIETSQSLTSHVFLWTGRFKLNMYFSILSLFLFPAGFYLGTFHGLEGVAFGWILAYPLALIPVFYFICKILHMPITDWLRALGPALTSCVIMAAAVLASRYFLAETWPHWLRLMLQAASGAMGYLLVMISLYRRRMSTIVQVVRGKGSASWM